MRAGKATSEARDVLRAAVRRLEAGDYMGVLDPGSGVLSALGADFELAPLTPLFVTVANGLWALARGDVRAAREMFGRAVLRLPDAHREPAADDGIPRAALRPVPESDVDGAVARLARIVWREQRELDHLCARAWLIAPTEALVEAVGQEASWTTHDAFYLLAVSERRHTSFLRTPPRQRASLCERATRIVELGGRTVPGVGPKAWRTAGGVERLFAEVIADLGEATSPVPWSNAAGAQCVPVRPGRLRLWEQARGARADRMAWT